MGEEGMLNVCPLLCEDKGESLCAMLFGVSCANLALKCLADPKAINKNWSESSDGLLQGSAHLLGLLMWRVQRIEAKDKMSEILHKLENAERENEELKKMRKEDAKASEKVVGIFAAQEQNWFSERKKLRQQIGALLNELRVVERKRDETISELNHELEEKEGLLISKEKSLQHEEEKRKEIEANLKDSEIVLEELRENIRLEAQEHCSELWKHKTAFIELVSNQRQLEAEMGRALKQAEASKQELDLALEQKEEAMIMAHNLSLELVKTQKDLDQKDKILSAMLKKSKLDMAEKLVLLKGLKLSKMKKKQFEFERVVSEIRHGRHSMKSLLSRHSSFKFHSDLETQSHERSRSVPNDFLLEYDQLQHPRELQISSPLYDHFSHEGSEELMFGSEIKHLESCVRSEAEKYTTRIERRHHLDKHALMEQLRLKDEKLEGFHRHLLSKDLESKRLQTRIEGLIHDILLLRQENMKLDSLILEREAEVSSLKQQVSSKFEPQNQQKTDFNPFLDNLTSSPETIWSNVKIIKQKPGEKEEEARVPTSLDNSPKVEPQKEEGPASTSHTKDIVLNVQSPERDFKDKEDVVSDGPIPSDQNSSTNTGFPWKMDLHALGVSYKIKRLKQQLLMLERFTGKQKSIECCEGHDSTKIKGFHTLMALLNKQVTRYQSFQGKIDKLCERMHENELELIPADFRIARSKNETKALENYLEEAFQLQRYIVSSGQKLMELQSKIVSGFLDVVDGLDGPASFDMKRLGDSIGTIFREVQRGLEVRVARIIGDVEGTLAWDGIIHQRR